MNNYGPFRPFGKTLIGGENWDLCFGESPHSVSDNTVFAKNGDSVIPFDGYRLPFKIVIEEFNYVKGNSLSGREVRKGCSAELFLGDRLVFDDFTRGYERAYKVIQNFIDDMEEHWHWYPYNPDYVIGRRVAYWNQLFTITSVGVNRLELTPVSGVVEKPFWMSTEDWDEEKTIITSITDPEIKWHVNDEN